MDIFISSDNKLVEISIYKDNNFVIFYDYLTCKEINKLKSYFLDSEYDTRSIYGILDKNNFLIDEVKEDAPEYGQIKMLVSNKFYKRPIDINCIIKDICENNQSYDSISIEQIYQDALNSLTAHTITLKNNNYGSSSLTENLSDDNFDNNDDEEYIENTIDFNMVKTLINI